MLDSIFKDKNLYYIGGIVRDEILGISGFDIDLTYQGNAIEKFGRLEECIKINKDFGTVRLLINGKEIDIASTRDETYEKKGHLPVVSDIGCSLKKDVLRRDFTVNTLAKSTLTGEIIDYTGGLNDIKSKLLKVLHKDSFIDDPTRIVRGLKFAVRFGFELDDYTRKLQDDYLNNINYDLSFKRLKKELMETFNLNKQECFDRFVSQKIYKLIGKTVVNPPKFDIESLLAKYPVNNIWIVYTGWHPDIENLPLTKEEKKVIDDYRKLISLDIKDDSYSIYKSFFDKQKESILLYTIVTGSLLGLKFFELKDIKISLTGEDLISLGIKPSNKFSECFEYILKQKLKTPTLTKSDEINIAKQFLGID